MKSNTSKIKQMYIGCYKNMNSESLKYNGTRINVNHGKRRTIKAQKCMRKAHRSKAHRSKAHRSKAHRSIR